MEEDNTLMIGRNVMLYIIPGICSPGKEKLIRILMLFSVILFGVGQKKTELRFFLKNMLFPYQQEISRKM